MTQELAHSTWDALLRDMEKLLGFARRAPTS
jgi:hypothetical protein